MCGGRSSCSECGGVRQCDQVTAFRANLRHLEVGDQSLAGLVRATTEAAGYFQRGTL